jgi:hypothetical protein
MTHQEKYINELRDEIEKIAELFAERRTDVSEMLYDLLDGQDISTYRVESRFPKARFGEMEVQYDTLTTQFTVRDLNDENPIWIPIPPQAHEYPDDGQPKTIGEL